MIYSKQLTDLNLGPRSWKRPTSESNGIPKKIRNELPFGETDMFGREGRHQTINKGIRLRKNGQ